MKYLKRNKKIDNLTPPQIIKSVPIPNPPRIHPRIKIMPIKKTSTPTTPDLPSTLKLAAPNTKPKVKTFFSDISYEETRALIYTKKQAIASNDKKTYKILQM